MVCIEKMSYPIDLLIKIQLICTIILNFIHSYSLYLLYLANEKIKLSPLLKYFFSCCWNFLRIQITFIFLPTQIFYTTATVWQAKKKHRSKKGEHYSCTAMTYTWDQIWKLQPFFVACASFASFNWLDTIVHLFCCRLFWTESWKCSFL